MVSRSRLAIHGHHGVPEGLLRLFSQRNAQVETELAKAVAACVDAHDGAEPDRRTLYRMERCAVLTSRPGKSEPVEADQLRAEWAARANHAGSEGNQGVTVDHGICVVEPASTRAGIYVAMTRGGNRNVAWVLDRTGREDAEESSSR